MIPFFGAPSLAVAPLAGLPVSGLVSVGETALVVALAALLFVASVAIVCERHRRSRPLISETCPTAAEIRDAA